MTESPAAVEPTTAEFSLLTRYSAKIISLIFHPLFVGVMMAAYLIFGDPERFMTFDNRAKWLKLFTVIINNLILPGLVVLLLRALGFSKSIQLKTKQERVVPYMACIIFFFWTWYVFKNLPEVPMDLTDTMQGMFFAVCISFFLNGWFKISMHAVGVGGLIGMMLMLLTHGNLHSSIPLAASFLVGGMVCSARLIISDHEPKDIIVGLFVGLFCQYLSFNIF